MWPHEGKPTDSVTCGPTQAPVTCGFAQAKSVILLHVALPQAKPLIPLHVAAHKLPLHVTPRKPIH